MIRETLMNRPGLVRVALALTMAVAMAACSGGGASTEENPVTTPPPTADYTGPVASNADVQAFKINVWDNIKGSNRCGSCHGAGGSAPVAFARTDDVNLAYQAANTVVTLTQPDQSRMVVKVAGGHNCWLSASSACGDTLTVWIRNWAGATATGGRTIQLQAPPIKEVGASKTFPADSNLFVRWLWNNPDDGQPGTYLQRYCARCHSSSAAIPQSPFFAGTDPDDAYEAAKSRINLDNPALSRFVVRLREEFHNCWTDCATAAGQMEAAVTGFANAIQPTQVDPTLVLSKALTLYDGTVAAGGNRYDTNVIALYEFKTGMGNTAFDTSGVEPALNLQMSGDISWQGGWGLNVRTGGKAQGTTVASRKLADMIKSTGEFTIEAWAANANVAQEDAYLVSYSAGNQARNFTLAQREYQYEVMTRSNRTNGNGAPSLLTNAADEDAQASLQHIVVTYGPTTGRRVYVNAVDTGDLDAQGGGSLADWDDSFAFVLGNETSTNRQWQGVLRLVAVHNRVLTPAQIRQNFEVGVGERYFMLFSVAHLTSVPQSYVMFEAQQFDSFGYLFAKPTFISLDPSATVANLPLRGMRIGLNGAEAKAGQAYIPLNATVGGSSYSSGTGQKLADVGTVIALEKGPESDEFFLSFEQIAASSKTYIDPDPPAPEPPPLSDPQPDLGVRTFDKLNATMSEITGVPTTNTAVASTFNTVRQALPTVEAVDAFLSSHQTAVAQLAIQYCDQLVDGPDAGTFFPGLNLNATASTYFQSPANVDLVVNPLLTRALNTNVLSAAAIADIRYALETTNVDADPPPGQPARIIGLIPRLSSGPAGSANGRTRLVTKAACAAVLGSAATLLH
jgi:hypothetical protein